MKKEKMVYETPSVNLVNLRVDQGILTGSPYGNNGEPGGDPGLNDDKYNYGGF